MAAVLLKDTFLSFYRTHSATSWKHSQHFTVDYECHSVIDSGSAAVTQLSERNALRKEMRQEG